MRSNRKKCGYIPRTERTATNYCKKCCMKRRGKLHDKFCSWKGNK